MEDSWVDIIFFKRAYSRNTDQFSGLNLLSRYPIAEGTMFETVEVKCFENEQQLKDYVNNVEQVTKLTMEAANGGGTNTQVNLNTINDEQDREFFNDASIITSTSANRTDLKTPSRTSIRQQLREGLSTKFKSIFSARKDSPSKLIVVKFCVTRYEGKKILDEKNLNLEAAAKKEFAKIKNFATANHFLSEYGTDVLCGEFRRKTIKYKSVEISCNKIDVEDVNITNSPESFHDLYNVGLRALGGDEKCEFSSDYPNEGSMDQVDAQDGSKVYSMKFNSIKVIEPAYEMSTFHWKSVPDLMENYIVQNQKVLLIPSETRLALNYLQDAWFLRRMSLELRKKAELSLKQQLSSSVYFKFRVYWNQSIQREVECMYEQHLADKYYSSTNGFDSESKYQELKTFLEKAFSQIYTNDLKFIWLLIKHDLEYLPAEVWPKSYLYNAYCNDCLVFFYYDRTLRNQLKAKFNAKFKSFLIYLNVSNTLVNGKVVTNFDASKKFRGILVDYDTHTDIKETSVYSGLYKKVP